MAVVRGPKKASNSQMVGRAVRGYTITTNTSSFTPQAETNVTAEACIRLLAQTVAGLQVKVVDERLEPAAMPLWLRQPMPRWGWDRASWVEAFVGDLLRRGDAYVVPVRDDSNRPSEVWLIPPEAVTVQLADDGQSVGYWIGSGGRWNYELYHCRYLTRTGEVTGVSPLQWALREAYTGAYVGDLVQRLTRDGLHNTGFYRLKGTTDPAQLEDLRELIAQHHGGAKNAYQQLVLSGDMEYVNTGATPRDAELSGLSNWSNQEVCRAFGVPPSLIGVAESGAAPYRNTVELMWYYHRFGVQPLLARLECLWNSLLPSHRQCEIDERPLLRGSPLSRSRVLGTMAKVPGAFTVDELREVQGLPPLPDGQGAKLLGEAQPAAAPEQAPEEPAEQLQLDPNAGLAKEHKNGVSRWITTS